MYVNLAFGKFALILRNVNFCQRASLISYNKVSARTIALNYDPNSVSGIPLILEFQQATDILSWNGNTQLKFHRPWNSC